MFIILSDSSRRKLAVYEAMKFGLTLKAQGYQLVFALDGCDRKAFVQELEGLPVRTASHFPRWKRAHILVWEGRRNKRKEVNNEYG